MDKLSASLEDYLEIICNYNESNLKLKAIDISKELSISRASVTEALKKLESKGFINYSRYETISLTETGKSIAKNIVSKHKMLQSFFEQVLGLPKDEASENACKIEHVIDDCIIDKIKNYTESQLEKNE